MRDVISVIVPAYNVERYIGRCLDSIRKQTYQNLEIIAVDDGALDGTGKIINQYAEKDPRIVVIRKENGGVSSARAAGIARATGEYIGFVDGDDEIEPEMYEVLLKNARKFQMKISHCGNKMIFPDRREELHYGTGKRLVQKKQEAVLELLKGAAIEPSLGNKLFHHSVVWEYRNADIWDERIKVNEDLLLNYLFFKKTDGAVFEDRTFYHYMIRENSATTSKKQLYHFTDPLKVARILCKDCENNKTLYPVVYERYLRALMNLAVQREWPREAENAKEELRKELLKKNGLRKCRSKKVRMMAIGVGWLKPIYKAVRKIYESNKERSSKNEVRSSGID